MKKIPLILLLIVCEAPHTRGSAAIAPEQMYISHGVDLTFLTSIVSQTSLLQFIQSDPTTLFRSPAKQFFVDANCLTAICASLTMKPDTSRPLDLSGNNDMESIQQTYEYLYKLQTYGFGDLIPSVQDYIKNHAELPSDSQLVAFYNNIHSSPKPE